MEMGIVNAGMLEVYEEIEPELKALVEDVLLNRRPDATERLVEHGEALKAASAGAVVNEKKAEEWRNGAVEERLSHALVKGIDTYIEIDAEEARIKLGRPLLVIEGPLMAGMSAEADLIGLSGLIPPSLDEMVHVAREMERQGFKLPLLIGGATTSRAHTAIKIAPHYSEPVVHVLDASRAVPVTTSLLSEEGKPAFVASHRADYDALRKTHSAPKLSVVSLDIARARRTPITWRAEDLPAPAFTGVR